MQNVPGEGDFEHYQGVWRLQPVPRDASNLSKGDYVGMRLTYAVEIRPNVSIIRIGARRYLFTISCC
jgi:hypothetical protein